MKVHQLTEEQYQEFIALAAEMRKEQKKYFKHRMNGYLVRSKELEAKLDKQIKQFTVPVQMPALF